jgi:transglutaminase-like putative cysteine protease
MTRPIRRIPVLLLAMLLATAAPVPATARDPGLVLPGAEEWPTDATLVPVDDPGPWPLERDLGSAIETALAQADELPAERWELEALAADLGPDIEPVFRFVRDSLGLDPYPGSLRGAQGTLAARAGSSLDRALLLRALLAAHEHPARIALGELDDAIAATVLERALEPPPLRAADPPASAVMALDPGRLAMRARRDHAILAAAVDDVLAAPGADGAPAGVEDVRRHAWVQVALADGTWLDLDPTLPDATPGEALAVASETADEVPQADRHAVVVRVVAELDEVGVALPQTVLEMRLDAAEAAESELWLTFQPAGSGIGGTLTGAIEGPSSVPVLIVAGTGHEGSAFTTATGGSDGDGDDFFRDFLGASATLAGLRLELESWSPGRDPLVARRVVWAPDGSAGELEHALSGLHHVMVSTGGASPRDHAIGRAVAASFAAHDLADEAVVAELPIHDLLLPLAVADRTAVVASERLIIDGLTVASAHPPARAFVARPRVYLGSFLPWPEVEGGSALVMDLALDDLGVTLGEGADRATALRLRLWYGTLQSALETELAVRRAAAVDPATRVLRSVSLAMSGPLRRADPDELATAPEVAREAAAQGDVVVLVGDQSPVPTFWAVDARTGLARAVMAHGLRVGFNGGGNYVNSSGGGPRYIVDPRTGREIGIVRDGKDYLYRRQPPRRCSGGTEYVVILGCVSIPASWAVGVFVGATVTAIVAWSIVVIQLATL